MSFSTISQVGDNIYVNVVFNNNTNAIETPAEYRVTKTIPILSRCSDYYCSVLRFSIPLNDVPLFIMPIIPNQTIPNPNLTPFIIGIRTGGIDFPQNVIYIPELGTGFPAPVQNKPKQVITPYYYVFEYQNFINAVNIALAAAFTAAGLPGNTPYFYLDNTTELIYLVVDIATFAPTATAALPNPPITALIFMNNELQIYFSAFQVIYVGPNASGRDYQFDLVRFGLDTTIPPFSIAATQKKFSQEYSVLQLWASLRKILIITNSIPVIQEFTPSASSDNGVSSTLPILTDFVPNIESAGESRSVAFYNPSSQYRLVDLQSTEQLNTIDLKLYWQDIQQNIYPIYITKFQEADVKIGFFKKTLYNYSLLLKK